MRYKIKELVEVNTGVPQAAPAEWSAYLGWALDALHLNSTNNPQHTLQRCYSEIHPLLEAIRWPGADQLATEISSAEIAQLEAFEEFEYPNDIGPGVYDIHSPNIAEIEWINRLLAAAKGSTGRP